MSLHTRPAFSNTTLLLVDCQDATRSNLESCLHHLGITARPVVKDVQQPLQGCIAAIVELEYFASPQTLLKLNQTNIPMVALTPQVTLAPVQRAIELGATALLNHPLTLGTVYTAVMMAIGLRERMDVHVQTIADLQQRAVNRPQVAMAVARLMHEYQLDECSAYERLRELAVRVNRSLDQLCAELAADYAHQRSRRGWVNGGAPQWRPRNDQTTPA